MISARPASDADAEAIAALRELAAAQAAGARGGARFLATEAGIPTGVETATFVGTVDDDVVGVATAVRAGDRVFVPELFCHPGARGVGVGHALLGAVDDQARAWGCTEVESWALPGDRDTKNFFEGHDMKARLLIVHRSL